MMLINKKSNKVNIQLVISSETRIEKSALIETDSAKLYIIEEHNDKQNKNISNKGIILEQENINQLLKQLNINMNISDKNYDEIIKRLKKQLTTYLNIEHLLKSNNIRYRTCLIY